MKTLEKLATVKGLGQKVASLRIELELAKGTNGVVAVKQEVLEVAKELDSIASQETGLTSLYTEAVERQLGAGKLRVGVRQGLIYLELVIQEYTTYLKERVKKEQILPDGVYLTLKEGEYDEVIEVEDGIVVWHDGYFREEYGKATEDELYKVIEEVKAFREENSENFFIEEEESTTDEA